MSPASALLKSEWRQGAILPRELVPDGTLPSLAAEAKLLVISHDCDVVNSSYDLEPYIEVVVLNPKPDAEQNGILLTGRNPRTLQCFLEASGKESLYEIDIHRKYRIERGVLENGTRDVTLKIPPTSCEKS